MRLYKQMAVRNECYQRAVGITPRGLMLHSTGANNPWLKRYVQPNDGRIGVNNNGNSMNEYRPGNRQVCPHGFIGKCADGTIASYQILPWAMRGWHSGKGSKGSANEMGYIGIEICEDDLTDATYFSKVYQEAVELFAYLCGMYRLNPKKDGVIICHSEGYKRGIASNHGDVMHWFPKHGKNMNTFREDVYKQMQKASTTTTTQTTVQKKGDTKMDLSKLTDKDCFNIMERAMTYAASQPEPDWSKKEGFWAKAKSKGIVDGTGPERPVKRDELTAILGRMNLL